MSVIEVRKQIDQYLDQVDENFLMVVHAMLETHVEQEQAIVSYDIDGTPRTAEELSKILNERVKAAERGEYITLEELREKSNAWLKRTK
ncbi:MAG: hypothetical protein AAGI38_02570 [Bacteroidota bacterium]